MSIQLFIRCFIIILMAMPTNIIPTHNHTENDTVDLENYYLEETLFLEYGENINQIGFDIGEGDILPVGPRAISFGQDEKLHILDTVNHRVLMLQSSNDPVLELKYKDDIWPANLSVTKDEILLLDANENSVIHFQKDGELISLSDLSSTFDVITQIYPIDHGIFASGFRNPENNSADNQVQRLTSQISINEPEGNLTTQSKNLIELGIPTRQGVYDLSLTGELLERGSIELVGNGIILTIPINVPVGRQIGGVSLLDVDQKGNFYIKLDSIYQEGSYEIIVDSFILKYDQLGEHLATVDIFDKSTTTPNQPIAIDLNGDIYQIVTDSLGMHLLKWTLTQPDGETNQPKFDFSGEVHDDESVQCYSSEEPEIQPLQTSGVILAAAITRDQVISNAEIYRSHVWTVGSSNYYGRTCSNGCPVGNAHWGIGTTITGVAYQWGGADSISSFDSKLSQGYIAGDVTGTGCIGSCATGVDCSGFVTNTWQSSRFTTSTIGNIATPISVSDIKKGDAFNSASVGHVVLFSYFDSGGNPVYYESQWTAAKVILSSGWSYISGYTPYKYNDIVDSGSCNNPSPNSDQVGIYADANYCGSYKIFGQGEWANPGAMGFSNDSVSSVKVGGNVKAVLCKDDNYAGGCEEFTGNDSNLSDNGIGDNSVSSMKVQSRGSSSGSWTARYFEGDSGWWDPNSLLNATPRCQENLGGGLDKNYGSNAPCGGMNGDNWVADYRGTFSFPAGNYVFIADHDDGFKLWIGENNVNIMDRGGSGSNDKACPAMYLNGTYNLRAILREQGGDARVKLWWTTDTSVCVQPPGSPSLSVPFNNATVGRYDNVTLSWNSVSGASEYYAEFSGGPGYSVNSGWTSGTSYIVGSTFWGGVYTWRVKARNSAGESGWSETRTLYRKYGAPSNLTLSVATQTQVNLTWSASSDAPGNIDGYRIYRNGSAIATVGSSTTGYTDNGLSCGGSYSYYVKAYKGSLESDPSETRNLSSSGCSAGTPVLVDPADGVIYNEGQSITLSWTDTGDQFYGEISGGPAGTITFGWQAETNKNIGSQWAGYNYTWKVKARNSVGESGFSNTRNFIVRPGQPTNLTATSPSCTRVNLTWSDNSGNEQGYQIYRNSALIATLGSNVTSYQDNSVSGESSYTYTVYAYRGSIQSLASSSVSVTTSICPPGNDNLSNPTSIISLPSTITQSTRGATIEAGEPPYPIGSNNGSSVWFSFKPASTGIFSIDTYGSDYDNVLHVFEKGTAITPIQGDDDEPAPNNTQSKVIFTGKSNVTYLISVTHYGNGSGGSLKLNMAQVPCASTSICVTATSPWYRPLTYYGTLFDSAGQLIQWFPLDDYGFGSVGNLSSGLYTVIISDYGVLKKVEGVAGPGVLGVTTVGLPTTVVSLKDLQSNPINAGVTLTNGYGQFNLGVSYTSSPMVVYATPEDYIVRLTNYDNSEKYLTYHRVTVNPGGGQGTDTFDVSQSPALIYNYHIQTIPNTQLVLWSGNTGNGPVISDGETAVLSFPTDMSFWADHIIGLDDTNDTWYYLFSRGNLSIQQFRQESEVYIGGDLQVGVTPNQAPYGRGDSAQISHYLKDSYNNSLMDLWTQAKPSTQSLLSAENSEEAKYNLGEQVIYKEGANSYHVSTSRELSQHIDDISPQAVNPITSTVEIFNPSNIQQFQETKSEWRGSSTWTIPNNALIGTWTGKVTMNYLGKWQGPTTGTNTFQVKDTPAPSNDEFNTPVVISQVPYSTSFDTFGATQAVDDPTIPKCNLNRAQATVWYRYTPSQSGTLSADTVGSDYDTVLAVWSGSRGHLTLVECNDDRSFTPHDQDSELVASLRAGTTYYIMAGKYSGELSTNIVSRVSSEKQVIQPMTMGAGTLQLHLDYTVSAPGAAEPISPNSTMLIRSPIFTWVPGINSTRYLIRIKTGANAIVFEKWLDAMDVCTADLCTYLLDKSLDNVEYSWQLQTWNTSGYGPWSSVVQFSVNSSESNEKKVFLPLVVR